MKNKECVFKAGNGDELIVHYRKSAVFFEREADLTNTEMYKTVISWRNGPVEYGEEKLHYKREEVSRVYSFLLDVFLEFIKQLEIIGHESWTNFEPKAADSMRADYDSYWDREMDDEGSLSLRRDNCTLYIEGPYQLATENSRARLYKFNKSKFESLVFDLQKQVKHLHNKPIKEKVSLFD